MTRRQRLATTDVVCALSLRALYVTAALFHLRRLGAEGRQFQPDLKWHQEQTVSTWSNGGHTCGLTLQQHIM